LGNASRPESAALVREWGSDGDVTSGGQVLDHISFPKEQSGNGW
jgi:hypothetical protein